MKILRSTVVASLVALMLAACAGGPIAIKSSNNVKTVVVDGHSIDVAEDGGIWSATPASFISNLGLISAAEQARRVQRFRLAIERVSGCQVVSSNTDPGTVALSASVQCKTSAIPTESQTAKPSAMAAGDHVAPVAPQVSLPRQTGQDAGTAERLAATMTCNAAPKAVLASKGPGFESYTVACTNGDTVFIRCEFGNCRALR